MAKAVLIGFMGAGKTTAARALHPDATDVDEVIEARVGQSVQEFFAENGEAAFREIEEAVTLELLDDATIPALSLGAERSGSHRVREALGDHRVVWLDVDPDEAWRRVDGQQGARPLARDRDRFHALHEARAPLYEALADVIVPAERSLDLERVLAALDGLPEDGVRVLWAATDSGDYPVYVGRGLLTEHRFWPATVAVPPARRVLVSDYTASRLYGELLAPVAAEVRIMPGEQSKTVAHAEIVWTEFARQGSPAETS